MHKVGQFVLALVNAEAEDVNLKNCALGGSIILSTGGSTFVSAEAPTKESCLITQSQPLIVEFRYER